MEKINPQAPKQTGRNLFIEQIHAVLPEAVRDGKIDFDILRDLLEDDNLLDQDEKSEPFGLGWTGKRAARRVAMRPPRGSAIRPAGDGLLEKETENVFIEGDNLEVLKHLRAAYSGRIKMIYIDPPYNTGNDFIYKDDFADTAQQYLFDSKQVDAAGVSLQANPKTSGRFHSNWLNFIYPRLRVAKDLLRDDGVLFVSIDDNEVHNLRAVLNEVFGEENFIGCFVWEGAIKNDSRFISSSHDFVLCYVRSKELLSSKDIKWRTKKEGVEKIYAHVESQKKKYKNDYDAITDSLKSWFKELPKSEPAKQHSHYCKVDERGVYFPGDISWPGMGGPYYDVLHPSTKKVVRTPKSGWRISKPEKMQELINENRVEFGEDENKVPTMKRYLFETEGQVLPSVIYKDRRAAMQRLEKLLGGDIFDNPKDEEVLSKFIEATTSSDDLILDFFAGSGTTAQAVLEMNASDGGDRKFICVQIAETIAEGTEAKKAGYSKISEITKSRIRKVCEKIKKETGRAVGFRSYKIGPSNFRPWHQTKPTVAQLQLQIEAQADAPLEADWTKESLLTEVFLLEGFPLHAQLGPFSAITTNRIEAVSSDFRQHRLLICLDEKIEETTVAVLEKGIGSDVFVCFDGALDSGQKIRLDNFLKLKTI